MVFQISIFHLVLAHVIHALQLTFYQTSCFQALQLKAPLTILMMKIIIFGVQVPFFLSSVLMLFTPSSTHFSQGFIYGLEHFFFSGYFLDKPDCFIVDYYFILENFHSHFLIIQIVIDFIAYFLYSCCVFHNRMFLPFLT